MKFINKKQRWVFSLYWLFFLIMGIALSWQHLERQHREAVAESLCATAKAGSDFLSNYLELTVLYQNKYHEALALASVYKPIARITLKEVVLTSLLDQPVDLEHQKEWVANLEQSADAFAESLIEFSDSGLYVRGQLDSFVYAPLEMLRRERLDWHAPDQPKQFQLFINNYKWALSLAKFRIVEHQLSKAEKSMGEFPFQYFPHTSISSKASENPKLGDTVELKIEVLNYSDSIWKHAYKVLEGDTVHWDITGRIDSFEYRAGYLDSLFWGLQVPERYLVIKKRI
jgi:hypothetical protein